MRKEGRKDHITELLQEPGAAAGSWLEGMSPRKNDPFILSQTMAKGSLASEQGRVALLRMIQQKSAPVKRTSKANKQCQGRNILSLCFFSTAGGFLLSLI